MAAADEHGSFVQRLREKYGQDEDATRHADRLHELGSAQAAEIRRILPEAESESIMCRPHGPSGVALTG